MRGVVLSVNVSALKGTRKKPVDSAELIENFGLKGDVHAGKWHRQVSLLAVESVRKLQEQVNAEFMPGDFAENILTEGICLHDLPLGTKITAGSAVLEVTQIGKECHNDCEIKQRAGVCIMPKEGIFARVIRGGQVKKGDMLTVNE